MKLTFRIEYRTAWGEALGATLCGNDNQPIMLSTEDGIRWEGSAEMTDAPAGIPISYRYGVYRDGQCIRRESGTMPHIFCPGKKRNCHYILDDFWKDLPQESYLYSSAFSGDYQSANSIKQLLLPIAVLPSVPFAPVYITNISNWEFADAVQHWETGTANELY